MGEATLKNKLLDPRERLVFYGTTPPKVSSTPDQIRNAAEKLVERVRDLALDGFVVYDVQDESGRTPVPRPFPFLPTLDSRLYSKMLHDLSGITPLAYKCIMNMREDEWSGWLDEARRDYGIGFLSLVGIPTPVPLPGAISVNRAFQVAKAHPAGFSLGGVAIAERHSAADSESLRIRQKAASGCDYFITQGVYQPAATIVLLNDYLADCRRYGEAPRRFVFTFIPVGRERTMDFMKWLGVRIAGEDEAAILAAPVPLAKSIEICADNLRRILDQPYNGAIPLGVNIESISINKDEINGSIDLLHALREVMREYRP